MAFKWKFFAILGQPFHSHGHDTTLGARRLREIAARDPTGQPVAGLNYRVRAVTDPTTLMAIARQEKPMLVLADLESTRNDILQGYR